MQNLSQRVSYDHFADCYHTQLPNGQELWCNCPVTLDDVLWRLDEHKQRKDETRAIVVSLLLSGVLLALAALLGSIWNA